MREALQSFFEANRIIVYSVYGQVFFTMGVILAIQSLRHSRLRLAQALPWLALFGILHGLHEWGDVFIPIQATYLPDFLIKLLRIAQVFLLALSFLCLFQFGISTFSPLPPKWQWSFWLPTAIFVVWLLGPFYLGLTMLPEIQDWHAIAAATARYALGLPGGLIAAYGLRVHAYQHIAPLDLPHIIRTLRIAGLAMAGYGIAGGVFGPAVSFFPGNVFNEMAVFQAIGIPMPVWRSLLGLILLIALLQSLEVFQVEVDRRIEEMERANILAMERERISRDLHDRILQQIYAAGLLAEALRERCEPDSSMAQVLDQMLLALNRAIEDVRIYISTLQGISRPGHLRSLLEEIARDPRFRSIVDIEAQLDVPDLSLGPEQAAHLAAILTEAFSNVIRHARARRAILKAQIEDGRLRIGVCDDGIGMSPDHPIGMGLRTMQERARLLGGVLRIESQPGHGTSVWLEVPVEQKV
ncbi:MAG TPA: ATP-binding protein [Thermoflexus sp.]|nr:ATP-binding protein [Thermoflexus sp.]